ncbi:ABC transporter substrate-binding protein [Brevibacillus ruminantium]|uniref:ABC transporter substrate-binding protein n=1 Tax=Brevibacillus ruminantium TaxID=2950604 RepID=A0ABY4WNJ6_9BACL|nr:ABC transporter substrate-binding protein [Brevibacillus ruminantium]USG66221.1 ABC transporter substrate-binding protein [Brevibacillus ruminantium]
MVKRWSIALATALSLISLTGCGTQPQQASPTAGTSEQTQTNAQPQAKPATGGAEPSQAPKAAGTLLFYTSQPDEDANALITAFTQKYPEVRVELFRSGTEEVVSRLLAEAEAKQVKADVLLLADAPTFAGLKKRDLLLSYSSPEAAGIPAEWKDADGAYTGTKVMATVLAYNTNLTKSAPESWKVLTEPAAADKAIMPSPLYSGAAAYNVGVFTRHPDFGWEFFQALKESKMTVIKGNGAVLKSVAGGEKQYGMLVDYMAARAKKEGSPIDLVYPKEGVPVITEPIGILKDSRNPDAAKAFVDFVLSEEGQKLAASQGYTPIQKGVQAPEGLKSVEELQILSADIAQLEAAREEDKKKFGEMMGGK